MKNKKLRKRCEGYLYVAPWLFGFIVLTLIPFLCLIYFSLTEYNMLSVPKWNGIQNYIEIFTKDKKFIASLKVTFLYVLVSVPLKLLAALLVAMLLNQKRRGIGIYRTLFYIPSIIGGSVAVAKLIFQKRCFQCSDYGGYWNQYGHILGGGPEDSLGLLNLNGHLAVRISDVDLPGRLKEYILHLL